MTGVPPQRDLYVTMPPLLVLNDNRLTYFQEGRLKQLSQTSDQVILELVA